MNDHSAAKFSPIAFALSVLGTLTAYAAGMRSLFPEVWEEQWSAGIVEIALTFLVLHLVQGCFFEYFFHRYVLHTIVVAILQRFARDHRRHHGLTPVVRLDPGKTGGAVPVRNRYDITHEDQYKSSFFPYWSLAAFLMVFLPWHILLQVLFPGLSILIVGPMVVVWSYTLYEVVHAIEHRSYEDWWLPKVEHPRLGWFWKKIYGFHLMHHANEELNESISGFFGLPVADWIFGTYKQPRLIFVSGQLATEEDLSAPAPRHIIGWLDTIAKRREARYIARQQKAALANAK